MRVTSLLCGPWADWWPSYGLYCKRFSLGNHTGKQKHTTLARLADFYLNPLTFVGCRNDSFLPIQILILWTLRNSADGHISNLGHRQLTQREPRVVLASCKIGCPIILSNYLWMYLLVSTLMLCKWRRGAFVLPGNMAHFARFRDTFKAIFCLRMLCWLFEVFDCLPPLIRKYKFSLSICASYGSPREMSV